MLHLIKIIIPLLIFSTNALILSAEELSEISEQTFIDKIKEQASSEQNEFKLTRQTPVFETHDPQSSKQKRVCLKNIY